MVKYPDNPQTLFNKLSLAVLCRNKQLAFECDRRGRIIDPMLIPEHRYAEFQEAITKHPITESFNIPMKEDLNELYDEESHQTVFLNNGEYEKEMIQLLGKSHSRLFDSNNSRERESALFGGLSRLPLTRLILYRITADSFVGIVFLTELFYHLNSLPVPFYTLTNEDGRIEIISEELCSLLGVRDGTKLLGKMESEWIKRDSSINRVITDDYNASGRSKEYVFNRCVAGEQAGSKYDLFVSSIRLPEWPAEFNAEIIFTSYDSSMPGILLWANEYSAGDKPLNNLPDGRGLHLTRIFTGGRYRYMFKEKGRLLYYADSKAYIPGDNVIISLSMSKGVLYLSENGMQIGSWHIPLWALQNAGHLLYYYKRENDRHILNAFRAEFRPIKSAEWKHRRSLETAKISNGESKYSLLFSSVMEVVSGKVFTLHLFNDVTELQKERDSNRSGLLSKAAEIAESDLAVLIEGETGTGKEVMAKAIHQLSRRRNGPFVKVDCSVLPENMAESELFGHKKGAFTGAVSDYTGKFELASNGTLFIDEIANLSLKMQAKLLGFLNDYSFQRVGGTKTISLNVRVICATNIPVKELIKQGRFREDLYYRINQYCFHLPPLRERMDEIADLANRFIEEANSRYEKAVAGISPEGYRALYAHKWPGNIRELKNILFRAALFCQSGYIRPEDISFDGGNGNKESSMQNGIKSRKARASLDYSRERVYEAIAECGRNITALGKVLNLSRPSVYKLLKRYE
ncbi:MAG: sigma-54-dependent Fis family transcriptional regulator [Fibrobacteres bacterium]|nr:sigma-54-dependent Fis family transcriptional regulator [Fibrobacterota bacterium]